MRPSPTVPARTAARGRVTDLRDYSEMSMRETTTDGEAAQLKFSAVIQGEARSDGYRPICDALWVWGRLAGFPSLEEYRLISSAARRLDSGHRQIERVREGIATAPPEGSIASREVVYEIIGDAELAVIALDKALDIIVGIPGRYRLMRSMPTLVTQKRQMIANLRNHYAHIDERALGKVYGKPNPKAEDAWEFDSLLVNRQLTDGHDSLGIDGDATDLCVAARGYLVAAWTQLVARGRSTQGKEG